MTLATLEQLKVQLGMNALRNVHDSELELYLAAASNVVRARVLIDEGNIPPEARLATLIIADHLWDTQRGDSAHPGFDDDAALTVAQMRRGYGVPRRAEHLLAGLPQKNSGPRFSFPDAPAYPAG